MRVTQRLPYLIRLADYEYVDDSELEKILQDKSSNCGVIIYISPTSRRIPPNVMQTVNNYPFTFVVNLRGRLISDVLTAMMTTPR